MKRNFLISFFIFFCFFEAHTKEIIHLYTISISKDLNTLYVKAQFGDIDFYYLYAGSKTAAQHTKNMHFISDKSKTYNPKSSEIPLKQNAANQTLRYEFDISASLGKNRWSESKKVGNDVIIPPDLWLWRPYKLQKNEHIEVKFEMPEEINYSIPWIPVSKDRYRISPTPYDWPSAAAFGTFDVDTVRVAGCNLSIAFLDGDYKTSKDELIRWIEGAAKSVCNVYGNFPVAHAQVIIISGGTRNEPVPFGMVVRGGGLSINFFIDPSRPINEFIQDWTATHELSHCLLPLIGRSDAWLSEGLATYYQYILMGRDGRLTEQETWQRIYNGFQKGIRGSKGETLKTTTEKMHEYRAFRTVYWSGAAMLLKADVALREQSNSEKSLDKILKKVQQNLLPSNRSWSGLEMIKAMDSLGNTSIFTEIYNTYIYSKEFPVDVDYWAELGVELSDNKVTLIDNAPLSPIRKSILKTNY